LNENKYLELKKRASKTVNLKNNNEEKKSIFQLVNESEDYKIWECILMSIIQVTKMQENPISNNNFDENLFVD
jgi:hypothetical protein